MTLVAIALRLLAVVLLLTTLSLLLVGRERIERTRREYPDRLREIVPYLGLLAVVLLANKVARDVGPQVSWLFGIRITSHLQRIDGQLLWFLDGGSPPQVIEFIQSFATPELTAYFSFIYVYGYTFLLVFPLVGYFALDRLEPFGRTAVAYSANYLIGVCCYVLFVALGPRNLDVGEGLLFVTYPEYQFLTSSINSYTNVFPSLHASLAVTAALLAWTTREEYPGWVPVAAVLAVSVVVATMYLGIHWASDVVAGIALGWVCTRIGCRYEEGPPGLGRYVSWLRGSNPPPPG